MERLSLAARMQLWQMSDVIVYSTVREAVNAHPLEYVVARAAGKLPAGVGRGAVLSESRPRHVRDATRQASGGRGGAVRVLGLFARAQRTARHGAREGLVEEAPDRSAMHFSGSLVMNPFSTEAVMGALETALEMPPAEKEARARKDLAHIRANTAEDWARQLLLPQRSPSMSAPSHGVVDDEARRFLTDLKSMQRKKEDHWMAVGFGLASFRMVGMDSLAMHCASPSATHA